MGKRYLTTTHGVEKPPIGNRTKWIWEPTDKTPEQRAAMARKAARKAKSYKKRGK